jgi:outer membrane receptor for ferrienterochelin and colicins
MKLRILCLGCWFLMASSSAGAEADDYLNMSLEQLLQVQVTGSTLHDETLKNVPSAVTVFTREELSRLGLDYLYELVNLVPGFQFDRNGDTPVGYTFSARGRRSGAEAREILLRVDGQAYADPRTGGADGSLPLFPLAVIERVEIIRGPGSALYGSNAFSGVINIITRSGKNSVNVAAGSEARRSVNILLSQQQNDWQADVFAQAYKDAGQDYAINNTANSYSPTTDPRQTVNINLGLRKGATQMRAAYHNFFSNDFYVAEKIQNNFNYFQQSFGQFSVEHEFQLTDNMSSHLALSYVGVTQQYDFKALPAGALANISLPASAAPLLLKALAKGETYRFTAANDWEINSESSAQFGVDWHQNKRTIARVHNNFDLAELAQRQFPISYYGDFLQSTEVGSPSAQIAVGIYAQYLRALSAHTRLTLGVRNDDYADIGKHLSPRLGLVQQLTHQQTLKLLYGEAYRAPSLTETSLKNNPVLIGNPNLRYEIVKTWDLMWLAQVKNTSITLDAFRNDYENPIVAGLLGSTRTYVNGTNEFSSGLEIEASQQLTAQWLVRATYTQFFELPETAFREAEKLSSLVLNYDAQHWGWNLSAVHHTTRNALSAGGAQQALTPYWFANTKLLYRLTNAYEINVQIKNIFNKEFFTPTQGAGVPEGIPNRGREWSLGFEWRY